ETLTARVLTLFGHAVDRVILQAPPKLNMGDLATPVALELAKALKRKPREIAETLANGMTLPTFVQSVSVEGAGYLNFRFDRGAGRRRRRRLRAPREEERRRGRGARERDALRLRLLGPLLAHGRLLRRASRGAAVAARDAPPRRAGRGRDGQDRPHRGARHRA